MYVSERSVHPCVRNRRMELFRWPKQLAGSKTIEQVSNPCLYDTEHMGRQGLHGWGIRFLIGFVLSRL